uniref:Uncharacterized protein n=1 Tax=Lepeophtheirus salmonis TaxID=72036 RepID=A0A0K2VEL0_LEPSM
MICYYSMFSPFLEHIRERVRTNFFAINLLSRRNAGIRTRSRSQILFCVFIQFSSFSERRALKASFNVLCALST